MLRKADEMKRTIMDERKKLAEERERFEREKAEWEQEHSNESVMSRVLQRAGASRFTLQRD